MTQLKERECKACSGETTPLKGDALEELKNELPTGWEVVDDHHLEREYGFDAWRDAVSYTMNAAEHADKADHHPDITLSYGKVRIELFTHKIGGLSENDFILAARLEEEHQAR